MILGWWSYITRHKFTSYLTRHYSTNKKFGLDIGCRQRPYDELYRCPYIGIDLLESQSYNDNVKPDVIASGEKLPFKNNTFDFITCYSVVPYVKDVDIFLDEMFRVIQSLGVAIVIIMNLKGLSLQPETNFTNRFNSKQLHEKLKKHGFESIKHGNPKAFFFVYIL